MARTATRELASTNEQAPLGGPGQWAAAGGGPGYISDGSRARLPEERPSCGVRRRMVACAVVAAVHQTPLLSSVVGGGGVAEGGGGGVGGKRSSPPEAVGGGGWAPQALPQPPPAAKPGAMSAGGGPAAASTAEIELLKSQLATAVDNKDGEKATLAIEQLEGINLTKENLEATRVGLTVNKARRDVQELWPHLSKRCRGLIKAWQRLVEPHTNSSSTSNSRNGTPGLVSPAVGGGGGGGGRRVTPHTPANKRLTPGLANERGATLSPANGSYAPRGSPGLLHKSTTSGGVAAAPTGGGMSTTDPENGGVRNGKRKAADEAASGSSTLKRVKTAAASLDGGAGGSGGTPTTPSLIEARRQAVQSTSDLVAQLTSNLPQHMNFEDAIRAHEERVRREQEDMQLASALANNENATHSPYVFEKKRKYERKQKPGAAPATPSGSSSTTITTTAAASGPSSKTSPTVVRIVSPKEDDRRGGLVLRLTRTGTDGAMQASSATSVVAAPSTPEKGELSRKEEKERRKREKKVREKGRGRERETKIERESERKKERGATESQRRIFKEAALHASRSAPDLASSSANPKVILPPEPSCSTSSSSSASGSGGLTTNATVPLTTSKASAAAAASSPERKVNWLAMLPSIEELQERAEKEKQRKEKQLSLANLDPEKAYRLKVHGDRIVLALPYLDVADKQPDFIKYKYANQGRFYSEENFLYGKERPPELQ